jgi:8-oxo-dGTP pyrophosphatase MutT (NUDIX family)
MYKININDNTIYLMDTQEFNKVDPSQFDLQVKYTGKTKILLSYVDMLEKTRRINKLLIYDDQLKPLKKDFESLFRKIRASGGVVEDESGKVLMIFRRGHWDLPKGKIDPGEGKKQAAIREVMEETGISQPVLTHKICTTRHCYRLKSGERVLKKTFWYAMKAKNQKLIPQKSEDIEKAKWVNPAKFIKEDSPIYSNILDVLLSSEHLEH